MTFIMLVIIAIMIGYGITIAKSTLDYIEQMNRLLRAEMDAKRMERQQLWDKYKDTKTHS